MSDNIIKDDISRISLNFVPDELKSVKKAKPSVDEEKKYRKLNASQIEILVKNNNFAEDWGNIYVTENFNPNLIINCEFYGIIKIGNLNPEYLEYHDLRLPVGIKNSNIFSCDIGDNVVIKDVHYLAHYRIGNQCILFNIDEMLCTNHAKFGNGIIKDGEDEEVRVWLEIGNENEGRKILPFESLIPADAYIWSKFRDDEELMKKLVQITESSFSKERGHYGVVEDYTVIKDCRILKDVKVGSYAYIKGANKIKNITILSSSDERTQIGEGVELVNGIVGYGSRIFYESKAIRFVIGRNAQLKYGARLLNSVLGDNSTVSCCELLNNLIFPFHEQHHNNSFLIASTIMGQSNIAAGATIGSNHNSRAPDGEIIAGRGFWPGLCSNFKHNSKFSSFTLIAKGSYSYELNISYPFSLTATYKSIERIRIMPAYWFIHNMYAMARNSWKFQKRDKRKIKVQNIEFEYLAPDTVQEILTAMERIEYLIGAEYSENKSEKDDILKKNGKKALQSGKVEEADILDPDVMKKFGGMIVKPARGWTNYRRFSLYFVLKTLIEHFKLDEKSAKGALQKKVKALYKENLYVSWVNIGGQIIPKERLEEIKNDIKSGKLKNWDDVHAEYNECWKKYPAEKARYSLYALERILDKKISELSAGDWNNIIDEVIATAVYICDSSFSSRRKDFEDPFRKMCYDNENEMIAVLGRLEDNSFLKDLKKQTDAAVKIMKKLKS